MKTLKVMFVCSGNVFRSMAAEYCLKEFLKNNGLNSIEVSSSGIVGGKYEILPETYNAMSSIGLDIKDHKPKKIDYEILKSQDVVVAMGLNHKEELKKGNIESILFNEACYGESSSIPDVPDVVPDWREKRTEMGKFIKKIVDYINDSIPLFYNYLETNSLH